jgi:hypothetical protein
VGNVKNLWTLIFVQALPANNSEKGGRTLIGVVGTFNHYTTQNTRREHNLYYMEFVLNTNKMNITL